MSLLKKIVGPPPNGSIPRAILKWKSLLTPSTNRPPFPSWSLPQPHYLKINTDASFLFSSKEACLGAVCRDDLCTWVEGIQSNTFAYDAAEAEINAILMALNWIKTKGWNKLILVTDCLTAWKEINLATK